MVGFLLLSFQLPNKAGSTILRTPVCLCCARERAHVHA